MTGDPAWDAERRRALRDEDERARPPRCSTWRSSPAARRRGMTGCTWRASASPASRAGTRKCSGRRWPGCAGTRRGRRGRADRRPRAVRRRSGPVPRGRPDVHLLAQERTGRASLWIMTTPGPIPPRCGPRSASPVPCSPPIPAAPSGRRRRPLPRYAWPSAPRSSGSRPARAVAGQPFMSEPLRARLLARSARLNVRSAPRRTDRRRVTMTGNVAQRGPGDGSRPVPAPAAGPGSTPQPERRFWRDTPPPALRAERHEPCPHVPPASPNPRGHRYSPPTSSRSSRRLSADHHSPRALPRCPRTDHRSHSRSSTSMTPNGYPN